MVGDGNEEQNAFGTAVRLRREAQGWTQADLSMHSGVSQSQVSKLERGEVEPMLSTAKAFARAFGVSLEALVSNEAAAATHARPQGDTFADIAQAIHAGRVAEASGKALSLPQPVIELAEAQAVGRAASLGRTGGWQRVE